MKGRSNLLDSSKAAYTISTGVLVHLSRNKVYLNQTISASLNKLDRPGYL